MICFSSISQPHNPDVVIASDDEDEFANIQRGTVVLKSVSQIISSINSLFYQTKLHTKAAIITLTCGKNSE